MPSGYVYPAAERPLMDVSVWWYSYSAWAFVVYSYGMGLAGTSNWRISNSNAPRFFCGSKAGLELTAENKNEYQENISHCFISLSFYC